MSSGAAEQVAVVSLLRGLRSKLKLLAVCYTSSAASALRTHAQVVQQCDVCTVALRPASSRACSTLRGRLLSMPIELICSTLCMRGTSR